MSAREEDNWRRFIMIRGPIGERRLDEHLKWIRQAQTGNPIEDCGLKFDYKRYFRSDIELAIEQIDENIDKVIADLEKRFGKSKPGL